jgi:hypothetical protein
MSYNIYQLAVLMHRKYEKLSKENNWDTQEECRVVFDDLPEANKKVMLGVAEFVFNEINDERKQGALEELRKVENVLFPWEYAKARIKELEEEGVEQNK